MIFLKINYLFYFAHLISIINMMDILKVIDINKNNIKVKQYEDKFYNT